MNLEPCTNCQERPKWKGDELIHSTTTCPNRHLIYRNTRAKSARDWNQKARHYKQNNAR